MASTLNACPHSSVQQRQSSSKAMQMNCGLNSNVAIRRCAGSNPSGNILVRHSPLADRSPGTIQRLAASGGNLVMIGRVAETQTCTAEDATSVQELDVSLHKRARVEGFSTPLQQLRRPGKIIFLTSFPRFVLRSLDGRISIHAHVTCLTSIRDKPPRVGIFAHPSKLNKWTCIYSQGL